MNRTSRMILIFSILSASLILNAGCSDETQTTHPVPEIKHSLIEILDSNGRDISMEMDIEEKSYESLDDLSPEDRLLLEVWENKSSVSDDSFLITGDDLQYINDAGDICPAAVNVIGGIPLHPCIEKVLVTRSIAFDGNCVSGMPCRFHVTVVAWGADMYEDPCMSAVHWTRLSRQVDCGENFSYSIAVMGQLTFLMEMNCGSCENVEILEGEAGLTFR